MLLQPKNIAVYLLISWFVGLAFSVSAQTLDKSQQLSSKKMKQKTLSKPSATVEEVKSTIIELDRKYQEAVKNNDAETMAQILADDFVLIIGTGKAFNKEDLLEQARSRKTIYERQEDSDQTVRVWGDTAVITALLWAKGINNGKPFEYKLWFSHIYRRTPSGWHYVFAQASLPIPNSP